MPIRVFFINARSQNNDEEQQVNDFLNRHRIVSVKKEFVADGPNSFWSLFVDFLPKSSEAKNGAPSNKRTQVDYRDILSPEDFAIFANLRELRKAVATREGVPIYTIFTNQQLADLVVNRVTTKEAFGNVKGVGGSRIEKYSDEFLASIIPQFGDPDETSEQPVPEDS